MTNKAKAALLVTSLLVACTDGGEATLRFDVRAIQALRAGLDPTSGQLLVSCLDGLTQVIPVQVDDTAQPITIVVSACGDARIDFRVLSTVGIPELAGGVDTVLRPGAMDVDLPVRLVGQLSVGLDPAASADTCTAVIERTSPDSEVIDAAAIIGKSAPTTFVVPIGSYRVTCDSRVADIAVTQGVNIDAVLADPVPGPRLVGTDLQPSYPAGTNRIDVQLTFSTPVTGFAVNNISIDNGGNIANVLGSGATYTVSIDGLLIATKYVITLSAGIIDVNGLPLVGAPVLLRFEVRPYEFYVRTTGLDISDGKSSNTPWQHIDYAVANATTPALIHVAAGDYDESVFVPADITIEGGWAPDFSVRDLATHISRLRSSSTPIDFAFGSDRDVVDGMWIEMTGQVNVIAITDASPRIVNCVILGTTVAPTAPDLYGVVVFATSGVARPFLANNVIAINGGTNSGTAIDIEDGASAVLINNTFQGNNGGVNYGVHLTSAALDAVIVNNLFLASSAVGGNTDGIFAEVQPSTLLTNAFAADLDGDYADIDTTYPIGAGDFGFGGRFGGNVEVPQNSVDLVLAGDAHLPNPAATSLNMAFDASKATCGPAGAAFPCDGPTTDRFGVPRTVPVTAGAYEL